MSYIEELTAKINDANHTDISVEDMQELHASNAIPFTLPRSEVIEKQEPNSDGTYTLLSPSGEEVIYGDKTEDSSTLIVEQKEEDEVTDFAGIKRTDTTGMTNKFLGQPLEGELESRIKPSAPQTTESFDLGFSTGDKAIRALRNDGLGVMLAEKHDIDQTAMNPDPNFNKEEAWEALDGKIHPDFKKRFLETAVSQEHMDSIYPLYYEKSARQRFLEEQPLLEQFGWGAMGEITNLPIYAGAVAMFPRTVIASSITMATRFTTTATVNVVAEGVKDVIGTQDKTAIHYASAILLDGTVGAVVGKSLSPMAQSAKKHIYKISGINKKVEADIKKAKTPEEKQAIAKEAYELRNGKAPDSTYMDAIDEAIEFSDNSPIQNVFQSLRQDMAYTTENSASDLFSGFSKSAYPDPTLQKLNKAGGDIATDVHRVEASMVNSVRQRTQPLVNEFAEVIHNTKNGFFSKVPVSIKNDFSELIGYVQKMKSINPDTNVDKLIKESIQAKGYDESPELISLVKRGHKEAEDIALDFHQKLSDAGNEKFMPNENGASEIPKDKNYMHFTYKREYLTNLRNNGVPERELVKFFGRAMKSHLNKVGVKNIDEERLEVVSKMFYDAVSSSDVDSGKTFSNVIDEMIKGSDKDTRELLLSIRASKNTKIDETAGIGARERTGIDYGYKEDITVDGKVHNVSMSDMISNDYIANMNTYARKMAGTTGLSKFSYTKKGMRLYPQNVKNKVMQSEDVTNMNSMIKERDDSILKLHEADSLDGGLSRQVSDALSSVGAKAEDLESLRGLVDDLGIKVEDSQVATIIENIKLRQRVDELSGMNLEKNIDDIINKSLKDAGIRKPIEDMAFELGKLLKKRDKEIELPKKQSLHVQVKNMIAKIKEEHPENVTEIESLAKTVNNRFNEAGKVVHTKTKERIAKMDLKGTDRDGVFREDGSISPSSDLYKKIRKEEMEKSVVNTNDIRDRFRAMEDKIYEPKDETFSLKSTEDIEDFKRSVISELEAKVASGEITKNSANKEIVRLNTIFKDFQGLSTAKDPNGNLNRFWRIAHSFNTGRLLGQTFFTMPAEAMTVAYDQGVRNFISSFGSFRSVLKAYRTGKIDNKQMAEVQEFTGMFNELLGDSRIHELDHDFSATGTQRLEGALGKVEEFGEKFAEFTLMAGGIKPLTAFFQTAHVMGVMKKMKAVAKGGEPDIKYKKMMNELGFSKESLDNIYKNIQSHADGEMMNFKKWDVESRNIFLSGVQRRTDTLVQQQRMGDKMAWVADDEYMLKDTFAGKVSMELKSFILGAYTKQLGYGIMRKDMHIVGLMSAQISALTIAYIAKQQLNYAGSPEKLKESLSPDAIAMGVLNQLPATSIFPNVTDMVSTATTGEAVFGSTRHSGQVNDFVSTLPTVDLLNNVIQMFGMPVEMIDEGIQVKDFDPAMKTLGITNSPLTRPMIEYMKDKQK